MTRARVAIADASPFFRSAVRTLLLREEDFDVLEAATLDELMALPGDFDVAVVDLHLPPAGGVAAAGAAAERCGARTLVWSVDPAGQTILDALAAGAWGYLSKSIESDALVASIRAALQGEAALAPELTTLLVEALHCRRLSGRAGERTALLSARERSVLELIGQGARNREIAAALAISEFTVKRHVQNILRKLDVPSRRAAAALLAVTRDEGEWAGAA